MNAKSFILGLGFGFILVSFLFIAVYYFSSGFKPAPVELTNDEIIDKARALGMIFAMELPSDPKASSDDIIIKARELGMVFPENINVSDNSVSDNSVSDNSGSDVNDVDDAENGDDENIDSEPLDMQSVDTKEYVSVIIYAGYTANSVSELLFNKGVVDSAVGFENYLKRNGATTNLRTGSYSLPLNSSYDFVLDALTKKTSR